MDTSECIVYHSSSPIGYCLSPAYLPPPASCLLPPTTCHLSPVTLLVTGHRTHHNPATSQPQPAQHHAVTCHPLPVAHQHQRQWRQKPQLRCRGMLHHNQHHLPPHQLCPHPSPTNPNTNTNDGSSSGANRN